MKHEAPESSALLLVNARDLLRFLFAKSCKSLPPRLSRDFSPPSDQYMLSSCFKLPELRLLQQRWISLRRCCTSPPSTSKCTVMMKWVWGLIHLSHYCSKERNSFNFPRWKNVALSWQLAHQPTSNERFGFFICAELLDIWVFLFFCFQSSCFCVLLSKSNRIKQNTVLFFKKRFTPFLPSIF